MQNSFNVSFLLLLLFSTIIVIYIVVVVIVYTVMASALGPCRKKAIQHKMEAGYLWGK